MANLNWKMVGTAQAWLRAFIAYAVTLTLLNLGVEWAVLFTAGLLIVLELLDEARRKSWVLWNFLDPQGFDVMDFFYGVVGAAGALLIWSFKL